jgi:hypothetical protein
MDSSRVLGIVLGVLIGGSYALLQIRALRRHEERMKQSGQSPSVAGMVPGSMIRVALLLASLVLVQVGCQQFGWNVSLTWLMVSLVMAYSIPFFWRLKDIASRNK